MIRYLAPLFLILFTAQGNPEYIDGIFVDPNGTEPVGGRVFIVVDSIPTPTTNYVTGLAFDGQHLWVDDKERIFYHIDTVTGSVIKTFYPAYGNRDMTFDGEYLWASDWYEASINKYDTSDCSIIATYYPPFSAGKPMGMAWDGTHLWVGEESGRIYQMTTEGETLRSIPRPPGGGLYNPRGLAFDGEYLWVGYQEIGIVYKIDTINGNVLESYSSPTGGMLQGVTFDGEYLWLTGGWGRRWIYKVDIGLGNEEEKGHTLEVYLRSYPNPFRGVTTIAYSLNESGPVELNIYNCFGQKIETLVSGFQRAGNYRVCWDAKDVPSGVYFYRLKTSKSERMGKALLVR
ncbi:hypothetical protein DRP53_05795 [candidate division WOR-3 bacterium]|uniref:Secretion system C-terminal sorting domain-containing protein n=1 Tax=candidate division WOR-3 bacterium TaxID=2052148 RepID=A0A660SHB5_UNCW3|nr:MAG: hypothetical protein DRP53_05795 [candidate division WOR-3 bacterium]